MPDTGSGLLNFVMRGQLTNRADVKKYFENPAAATFAVRLRRGTRCEVRLDAQQPGKHSFGEEDYVIRTGDVRIGHKQESATRIYYDPTTNEIITGRFQQVLILR